jgi:hypothetical protein
MKTFLRLFGKFTRWYITLIIFMACLLFIITTRAIWLASDRTFQ